MIARQRGGDQRPDFDFVPDDPRAFDNPAEPDERDLRRVVDAECGFNALLAEIRGGYRGRLSAPLHAQWHCRLLGWTTRAAARHAAGRSLGYQLERF